ncbi:helix-turn-helix domain-containing protein [Sphingobacterium sp. HJSM2_6]|uniref:helix-turn-helix domain-containing protein n=1 Tax=Sphingobacterium sp. HJSM2_6 TaxID=3366264 RepID=UPI003BCBA1A0
MKRKKLIHELPYAGLRELNTLVEHRKAYTLDNYEFNVFETYEASHQVPLQFDDLVIINMLKGKKVMHIDEIPAFEYLPGETLILPASKRMQIDFPEARFQDPTQCTALVISKEKITETIAFLNDKYPKGRDQTLWGFSWENFHIDNTAEICELADKLFANITSQNPLKDVYADLIFKELLVRIIQQQQLTWLQGSKPSEEGPLAYLKNYIANHITDKLTIEDLSSKVNMSKASLFRLFKEEFDISPMELVIQERIKFAKEFLKQKSSVKEACYASGFSDVNYFIRVFKQREQVTPGQFQRNLQVNVS